MIIKKTFFCFLLNSLLIQKKIYTKVYATYFYFFLGNKKIRFFKKKKINFHKFNLLERKKNNNDQKY